MAKYELKRQLEELIRETPDGMDKEIRLFRPMGEPLMFYSFERDNITLTDDYIEFHEKTERRKVLYKNIVHVEWRTLFLHKPMMEIKDGEYNMKEDVSAYGQSKNNDKSDDSA